VIAAEQASDEDQRSNDYRVLENRNIDFTIHQHPFTGVGFGQKFYIVASMPDISWFEWWEYITHNSIMWIWMKTGVGGFFSVLFLFGLAVVAGVRALGGQPGDEFSAVVLMATLSIVMHFIYACVDLSWEPQGIVYVATLMGLVNRAERIGSQLLTQASVSWHWKLRPQPLFVHLH
jgi:O-antigen ligase